jgi:hypothetical protein
VCRDGTIDHVHPAAMTQITLSDEQARQLAAASVPIILVDTKGRELGRAESTASQTANVSDESLAQIKQRMRSPAEYLTFDQLTDRLGWQDQR